ncbi:MAG: cytochrome P450, partial [Solirubrobacterales bacterium]|nr:cytochrome P450 [Solirubrobacterales bacterium]
MLRPIAFMEACRRRFGDTFSVRFTGFRSPLVMTSDPTAIRILYSNPDNRLPPGRSFSLEPVVGSRSLLLQEGAEHLERRRLMLPQFHGQRIRAYEELVAEIVDRELERCPLDRPFAAHPHIQHATLEVILRAVFGVTDSGRLERLRRLLPQLLDSTSSTTLQLRILLARRARRESPVRKIRVLKREIGRELSSEISERRRDGTACNRNDILSMLLVSRFEDGGAMDDPEVRDQLMTLLVAGHETTATALAWSLDLLVQNPVALARLTEELEQGEGEGYLRAVIQESLRLRPVVSLAGRRLASELV